MLVTKNLDVLKHRTNLIGAHTHQKHAKHAKPKRPPHMQMTTCKTKTRPSPKKVKTRPVAAGGCVVCVCVGSCLAVLAGRGAEGELGPWYGASKMNRR